MWVVPRGWKLTCECFKWTLELLFTIQLLGFVQARELSLTRFVGRRLYYSSRPATATVNKGCLSGIQQQKGARGAKVQKVQEAIIAPGFHLSLAEGLGSLQTHQQLIPRQCSARRFSLNNKALQLFLYLCYQSGESPQRSTDPHDLEPVLWPPSILCPYSIGSVWRSPRSVLKTLKLPRNIPFCLCWELHQFWIVKYLWTHKQSPHYVRGSGRLWRACS